MNRHFFLKHYAIISLVALVLLIGAIPLIGIKDKSMVFGSAIAGALGYCYFAQRQKLAETQLFKELFVEFNDRYNELNDRLVVIGGEWSRVTQDERNAVIDYFNLCAEEYLFAKDGYIHQDVWRSWCLGMLEYFEREPFIEAWREESARNSYYGMTLDVIQKDAKK